jgi:hypothetical protein
MAKKTPGGSPYKPVHPNLDLLADPHAEIPGMEPDERDRLMSTLRHTSRHGQFSNGAPLATDFADFGTPEETGEPLPQTSREGHFMVEPKTTFTAKTPPKGKPLKGGVDTPSTKHGTRIL